MVCELTMLGTSSMVPTKERNVQSFCLSFQGELILVDCGEGTQRQMNIAGLNRTKVTKILLTHWHGDHVSGLIGLLQTIGNGQVDHDILIIGPRGTKERMNHLLQTVAYEKELPLTIVEVEKEGEVHKTKDYHIEAYFLEHSTPCVGYRFVEADKRNVLMTKIPKDLPGILVGKLSEGKPVAWKEKTIKAEDVTSVKKGKVIGFVADTALCNGCFAVAKEADLLITECTYAKQHKEKAHEYKHLCTQDVCAIISQAEPKKTVATHFSQRYKDLALIEEELKTCSDDVELGHDFKKIKI
ncbi:MAG: ribonuclease Z [Candidatus Woesearchaeota archaeon]|nr:MAG: ribonuclease Z [Candidatus Woesearchaeota archaeon]